LFLHKVQTKGTLSHGVEGVVSSGYYNYETN